MIQTNTSKSALSLNVNNARRDLLYQLKFFEGKDFCSLHCNIKYQEGKDRLFFDKVEKTLKWRTHQKKDMLPKIKE